MKYSDWIVSFYNAGIDEFHLIMVCSNGVNGIDWELIELGASL